MTMRERIKAIERSFEHYAFRGSERDYDNTITNINAAITAADEREREFERAREAWRNLQAMGYVVPWDHDGANYQESLDAYFNPAKEG